MNRVIAERSANRVFEATSFLNRGSAAYVEQMQQRYNENPSSVDSDWRDYFASLGDDPAVVRTWSGGTSWAQIEASIRARLGDAPSEGAIQDTIRALALIDAYRARGHFAADLDPLGLKPRQKRRELDPATYGFSAADWDRKIFLDGALGQESATLREIVARLDSLYCSTVGYDFAHISDQAQKAWLLERVEGGKDELSRETKRAILQKLVEVKGFERFLDKKFVGTKRFGLDGAEAAIPALEQMVTRGAAMGVTEVVIGMAHRGRLNVMSQVMGKPHRAIMNELKGGTYVPEGVAGSGDMKYHLGVSTDREFDGRMVHLSLTANPSHLEIADPVVLGKVRAKQDQKGDRTERTSVLPLLIHGDAAFAGQGVVAEIFGLSELEGFRTGGSLHLIINNQIGFTTDPRFARSTAYPSDLAKVIEAPIFHVNGDDLEAVAQVAALAVEFRQTFRKPAVIDLFCFRLYGHNEGDEPGFTQPEMYKAIRSHKSTLEIYGERLTAEGVITAAEIEQAKADWAAFLDEELAASESYGPNKPDWLQGRWAGLTDGETGVALEKLREIGGRLVELPENFHVHGTIQRFIGNRGKMVETGQGIDWAMAESLALGSLLDEGHGVRFSSQDSERGTFTQRHSAFFDQETGEKYAPLDQFGRYEMINSMLSEEAVLGFEYGYSIAEPNSLVLWEAQFGDFANGAQVVFDQFLAAGERKWLRMSGLVVLLPHGYDGQGPEHSSARLERYLQSSAEENWQVANVTTPANYFHILRRQLKRSFRKPLILMTPKSLLRHRLVKSDLAAMARGTEFQPVLRDDAEGKLVPDAEIRRVVLSTGKVYYDLLEEREKRGIDDVYLLRVEQLYPFPTGQVAAALGRFKNAEVVWCQEEPRNMGAWSFAEPYIEQALLEARGGGRARYAGRAASASTATGQMSQHMAQLQAFLDEALS